MEEAYTALNKIAETLSKEGIDTFICGGALGFDTFAAAEQYLDDLWHFFQEHRLLEKSDAWNVNFPEETDGKILITRQGGPFYSDDFVWKDNKVYASGKCVWPESDDMHFDTNAVLSGKHISVTPICNDRTDWKALSLLEQYP